MEKSRKSTQPATDGKEDEAEQGVVAEEIRLTKKLGFTRIF